MQVSQYHAFVGKLDKVEQLHHEVVKLQQVLAQQGTLAGAGRKRESIEHRLKRKKARAKSSGA